MRMWSRVGRMNTISIWERWQRIRCRRRFKLITPMHMQQQQQQLVKEAAWQGTHLRHSANCSHAHTHTHTSRHRKRHRERERTAKVLLCREPKCCVLLLHVGATSAADLPQLNHISYNSYKGQQQQQWRCSARIIVSAGSGRSEMQLFTAQQVSHNFDTLYCKWKVLRRRGWASVVVSKQLTPVQTSATIQSDKHNYCSTWAAIPLDKSIKFILIN